ncbi:hypothetical protein [Nostoc sp. UIC 10630]|uniref:hypothetical protein n=1 Tax=Nostoc sp. UIC 10630 TaxID=2100146 RepID=UPI0013D26BB4|nr:hypothetical protein [Nostoc sp. UIC 10630]NEU77621.1 hypothetical protein [Nostoc sp. UIC 10630]
MEEIGKATSAIAFVFDAEKAIAVQADRLLNSYADSGKVTVLGIGFTVAVGVADGVGAR